jgi:hypothetical protein
MVDGLVVEEYEPKKKIKDTAAMQGGKKSIGGQDAANVRDPHFLEKLQL